MTQYMLMHLVSLMDVHSSWSFSLGSVKADGISKNMSENKVSQWSVGWCWLTDEMGQKVMETHSTADMRGSDIIG